MPSFAGLGKFFGRTASEGAAFAAGIAVAPALAPVVKHVENEAWAKYQTKPLAPGDLAEIVGEDVERQKWGEEEAAKTGIKPFDFDALVQAVLNAPDLGTLYRAWRRAEISDGDFLHGLRKARLEERWDKSLKALKDERLSVEILGALIQRSLVPAPFQLPYEQVGDGGKIPAFRQADIDPFAEAAASGYDSERLYAETALSGNPPGPQALYRAKFRDAINEVDVQRGLAEGRSRQEWAPAFEADAREIPSSASFVEGRLRGWLDDAEMNEGTARHGMTEDDTHLLFLIHGRPLVHNQVFIGLLRGGVYDGPTDQIPAPFLKSLQESNMRPEWYNLVWAQRYHYPPFFQTVNLLNKGLIDAETATDWLTKQAYAPDAIKTVVEKISGAKAPKADTRVTSAQTKLLNGVEKAYIGGVLDEAAATAQLTDAGLSATTAAGVLAHWKQLKTLESTPPPTVA